MPWKKKEVVKKAKKKIVKGKKETEAVKEPEMNPEFSFEVEGDPSVMWIPKDQLADDISVCNTCVYASL
jgi:hypothetical protein